MIKTLFIIFKIFISINAYSAPASKSHKDALILLAKINEMFNIQIDLLLDDELCGFAATTIDDKKVVEACISDVKAFDKKICGENSEEGLAMIIAHEASHLLLESPDDFNLNELLDLSLIAFKKLDSEKQFIINKERVKELRSHLFDVHANQEHEYVDGLAAKILKSLGYSEKIKKGMECIVPLPTYAGYVFPGSYFMNREEAILKAYREGWTKWEDCVSAVPVKEGPLFDFLDRHNHDSILKTLKISGQLDIIELSIEIWRRLLRYGKSIPYKK
jgi:hypothetical protein